MVLQKRLDYCFNGYQVPPTPRATRSARRRGSFRRKVDEDQICAFDLLATVAGKLLLEGERSETRDTLPIKELSLAVEDTVKRELHDDNKSVNVESCDQGSWERNFFVHDIVSAAPVAKHNLREFPQAQNYTCSGPASVITSSDCSEKIGSAEKLASSEKVEPVNFISKEDVYSSSLRLDNERKKEVTPVLPNTEKVSVSDRVDNCSLEAQVVWDRKLSAPDNSEDDVKLPLHGDHLPCGSFPVYQDNVKLAIRDDDENSSGCTQPGSVNKACRPPTRIGDRRVRKLLASKYWKVTSKFKEEEKSNADAETKTVCHNRKHCFKRLRSQRDYPFKKRKLYGCSSVSNSDGVISSDGISSSPRKGFGGGDLGLGATMNRAHHAAMGASNLAAGQHASFRSRDSHVKLKIKSFRVPELFIEIPETATVGSLKRSVMEAVTAILNGELRIGVFLQGKKIRDDNKTLLQTGISHDKKLDALGFTLEPCQSQAPPPLCHVAHPFLLPCDASDPLARYPTAPSTVRSAAQKGSVASPEPPVPNSCNFIESDHDSAPSPPDTSVDKNATDSRALVAVPPISAQALSAVPMRKSKRSEAVQRRIRRPFSVSEVEALVQAVEKLGTGRWRDVKLRAFDNAKHRTYVDLKDKWKTLVHTARISPQQRRGEPVPQELLDRVLSAHAYWSQQAKQQLKQQPETCLLL